jgi:AcrR family transcriptional regulator
MLLITLIPMSEAETDEKQGKRGDTRARLMEAAETLFGERGLHGVTLKEINAAAGQRNESALHYHFGSRAGLIDAVLGQRVKVIDARRVEKLDALMAAGREHDLRAVLRATFEPITELLDSEDGVRFVRFAAQVLNDPDFDLPTVALRSGYQGIARANALIVAALGDLPPEIAVQRQRFMLEMALTSLSIWTRRDDAMTDAKGRAFFVANLLDEIAGALQAPIAPETLAALKALPKS